VFSWRGLECEIAIRIIVGMHIYKDLFVFVYNPPPPTVVSISNNALENKGLKKLLDLLPHLSNIQEIK
jgi:hypothetical protein